MSACISSHGEYSEHELSEGDPFTCAWCGAFDEVAAVAADRARHDALGYVEQTMYANGGSPRALAWRNDEVMSMLAEVAELLRGGTESSSTVAYGSADAADSAG